MENIRQARMRNVSGTRQAETAAHNLHELGQKLKQPAAIQGVRDRNATELGRIMR